MCARVSAECFLDSILADNMYMEYIVKHIWYLCMGEFGETLKVGAY